MSIVTPPQTDEWLVLTRQRNCRTSCMQRRLCAFGRSLAWSSGAQHVLQTVRRLPLRRAPQPRQAHIAMRSSRVRPTRVAVHVLMSSNSGPCHPYVVPILLERERRNGPKCGGACMLLSLIVGRNSNSPNSSGAFAHLTPSTARACIAWFTFTILHTHPRAHTTIAIPPPPLPLQHLHIFNRFINHDFFHHRHNYHIMAS